MLGDVKDFCEQCCLCKVFGAVGIFLFAYEAFDSSVNPDGSFAVFLKTALHND